jgi:polar amino acid transport system permease protein
VDRRRGRRAGARLSHPDITVDGAPSRRQVREAARRRQARRGAGIAAISSALLVTALVVGITSSPGWDDVRALFLSWEDFKEAFPDVLRGFWLDIKLFVIVEVCVLVLAMLVALARLTRSPALFPLRILGAIYTDVFRGLPTILVIYAIGFGVPALVTRDSVPFDWMLDPAVLGGIALTLCYSAYVAEVYRAGIESVHPSQRAAARSLGLTGGQTMRFVVLPQAVRRVIPPLLNDFIALQKDVALVSILGASVEAFRQAQIYAASNFNYTPLLAAGFLYLCVTIPLARVVDHLQSRDQRLRAAGGAV